MTLPFAFAGLLAAAGAWDLCRRRIPNVIPAALIVLFALAAATGGFRPLAPHLISLAIAAILGIVLFYYGVWGGGDAKLLMAIAPFLVPQELLSFLLITGCAGGIIAAAFLVKRRLAPVSVPQAGGAPGEIPYGLALVAGGLNWWGANGGLLP
jgi:prepilin peptidase CpaA